MKCVHGLSNERDDVTKKLTLAEKKLQRLEGILQKKAAQNGPQLNAYETTLVRGFPVSDFRMPQRGVKVTPMLEAGRQTSRDAVPSLKGPALEGIHQRFMQRTVGNREVHRKQTEIEQKERAAAERAEKRTKKPPKVSIPMSMLPNRYIRGELPCTIEHGTKGHYLSWVCPLENLDYDYYLPLFFDGRVYCAVFGLCPDFDRPPHFTGLQCKDHPVSLLARQVKSMI